MIAFRKSAFLCCLTIALLGFALRSFAADVPSPVAAVHAADDSWVKAYNSGDLDTVVGLYDEHAVIYPPGAPPAHGGAAIRVFFAKDNAEFLRGGLIFSLGTKPDGGVAGNSGWSSGTYTWSKINPVAWLIRDGIFPYRGKSLASGFMCATLGIPTARQCRHRWHLPRNDLHR
jgi:hypothetical protein